MVKQDHTIYFDEHPVRCILKAARLIHITVSYNTGCSWLFSRLESYGGVPQILWASWLSLVYTIMYYASTANRLASFNVSIKYASNTVSKASRASLLHLNRHLLTTYVSSLIPLFCWHQRLCISLASHIVTRGNLLLVKMWAEFNGCCDGAKSGDLPRHFWQMQGVIESIMSTTPVQEEGKQEPKPQRSWNKDTMSTPVKVNPTIMHFRWSHVPSQ